MPVLYAISVGVLAFPRPPFLSDLIAPFYAPRARWYLYTPTLEYLAYRAYANARAYPCNGVGTRLVITMSR